MSGARTDPSSLADVTVPIPSSYKPVAHSAVDAEPLSSSPPTAMTSSSNLSRQLSTPPPTHPDAQATTDASGSPFSQVSAAGSSRAKPVTESGESSALSEGMGTMVSDDVGATNRMAVDNVDSDDDEEFQSSRFLREAPIPFRTNPLRPGLYADPAQPMTSFHAESSTGVSGRTIRNRYQSPSLRGGNEESPLRRRFAAGSAGPIRHHNHRHATLALEEEAMDRSWPMYRPRRARTPQQETLSNSNDHSAVHDATTGSVPPPRPLTMYGWNETVSDESVRSRRRQAILDQIDRRRADSRLEASSVPQETQEPTLSHHIRSHRLPDRLNHLDVLRVGEDQTVDHSSENIGVRNNELEAWNRNVQNAIGGRLPIDPYHGLSSASNRSPLWGDIPPVPVDTANLSGHDPINPRRRRAHQAHISSVSSREGLLYQPGQFVGWYGFTGEEFYRPSAIPGDMLGHQPFERALMQHAILPGRSRQYETQEPNHLRAPNIYSHPAHQAIFRGPIISSEISADMSQATKEQLVQSIIRFVARMPSDSRRRAAESVLENVDWAKTETRCVELEMDRDQSCSICHDEVGLGVALSPDDSTRTHRTSR